MPQPTRSDVHVNKPLTNISIAFIQEKNDFVADKVFPRVPVTKQSDRYFTYTKGNWYRDQARKRAPGTESAGSGFEIDNTPTYFADVYALHKDVDDQTRANADAPIDMDRDATLFVTEQCMLRQEKQFATQYYKTSTWTGSTTGGDITPAVKWDDAAGDPISDIDEQKKAVRRKTGRMPNILVVSGATDTALRNNADVKDRIKYTQRAVLTADIMASLLGVDKYLVALASENTAAEGATDVLADIFTGDSALLVYAPQTPSLMQPSGGYIFSWSGFFGAGPEGTRIKKFRMEPLSSDRIECEQAWDMKLVAAEMGVFFVSTTT